MAKHENNGACKKCDEILSFAEGVHIDLHRWFMAQQSIWPNFHVSCGVRGKLLQMEAYRRHASKAQFGQSSHNFGAAIDTFFLIQGQAAWPEEIYEEICGKYGQDLPDFLKWYGVPNSQFYELPHFELRDWKQMVKDGKLKLTEED